MTSGLVYKEKSDSLNSLIGGGRMLYIEAKKDAIRIHEEAKGKYNRVYHKTKGLGNRLYDKRCDSVLLVQEVEELVNSIANNPKDFHKKISDIQTAQIVFHETEEYAKKSLDDALRVGMDILIGIAEGEAVACIAPTTAMWVATTFGHASTGTAISALHGVAATKAALAWLGGGALGAGGAGVAGGQALLALAGPIGWGISGTTTAISIIRLGYKNKEIADDAINEAKKITMAGAELNEASAEIQNILDETVMLMDALREMLIANQRLRGSDYLELSEEKQYRLGTMVNNTFSLAQLLNRTI